MLKEPGHISSMSNAFLGFKFLSTSVGINDLVNWIVCYIVGILLQGVEQTVLLYPVFSLLTVFLHS